MADYKELDRLIINLESVNYEIGYREGKGDVVQTTMIRDRDKYRREITKILQRMIPL